MKKILFYSLYFVLMLLCVELLSLTGLFFLKKVRGLEYQPIFPISLRHKTILQKYLSGDRSYLQLDPTLGWTIAPDSESENGLYRSNAQGIRADRNYAVGIPSLGHFRIASFGDSFTHCNDVTNADTWEAALESMNSDLEVLNFGVLGHSLDQAYLRYKKEGLKFHPHIVLIGFMSENIKRLVNTFKPFYFEQTGIPFSKPRFIVKADQLFLLENPLSTRQDLERLLRDDLTTFDQLKANDYYATRKYSRTPFDFLASIRLMTLVTNQLWNQYKPNVIFNNDTYNSSSEAYKLTTKLMDEFYQLAESNSSVPVIVLFPLPFDVEMYLKSGRTSYSPLVEYLKNKEYRYIDLLEPLKASIDAGGQISELIPSHYSAKANKLIGQFIYSYLQSNDLLGAATAKPFVDSQVLKAESLMK